jgi:heptosyltransferase I
MKNSIRSICIVRLSALGDVLMLVPLIRTLQTHFSQATITWIISRPAYDLVEGLDGVEFIVIDKPNNLKDYWNFKRQMQKRSFDVLLAAQASFRANCLYPCINARRKIGYDSLRANDGHGLFVKERIQPGNDHTLDGFLKFATALGVTKHEIRWDLPIAPADYDWADKHIPDNDAPLLILNPAASKPERSWMIERYIEVIKFAQQHWNARVVLTGGPGDYDRELGAAIAAQVQVTNLIGLTKPKQLLAVLSKAKVIICPDTGPSHMGVAVGTPVIALHAVTSANVSGPYTFRHLSVDYYNIAAQNVLKTAQPVWGTHVHGSEAMTFVPVVDVCEKLRLVLQ